MKELLKVKDVLRVEGDGEGDYKKNVLVSDGDADGMASSFYPVLAELFSNFCESFLPLSLKTFKGFFQFTLSFKKLYNVYISDYSCTFVFSFCEYHRTTQLARNLYSLSCLPAASRQKEAQEDILSQLTRSELLADEVPQSQKLSYKNTVNTMGREEYQH